MNTDERKAAEAKAERLAEKPTGAEEADLLAALEEISKGVGPFSQDHLTHAKNTIEAMKGLARAAIAKAKGGK